MRKPKLERRREDNSRSAAYLAAWEALPKEPLDRKSRFAAQTKLLAEWANIDLVGALDAFLGEAWDFAGNGFGHNPLEKAFSASFMDQPLASWEALGRQPMAKYLLGDEWVSSVFSKEPKLVISMLGELPPAAQAQAISILANNAATPENEELVRTLASSGNSGQLENWMSQLYRQLPLDGESSALLALWSKMPKGGERTRQMAAWARSVGSVDANQLASEWGKISDEDRGQAARMLLAQINSDSPALLEALNLVIGEEQWGPLAARVGEKLHGFSVDSDELAEWALTLPPREDVRGIFKNAIAQKLTKDPVGGRQWLEQLPPGDWHREYGFVQMTNDSLWSRRDPAAAQRAIDAITDTRARQVAVKALYDWHLLTDKRNVIRAEQSQE
jgi:hypothetical protein